MKNIILICTLAFAFSSASFAGVDPSMMSVFGNRGTESFEQNVNDHRMFTNWLKNIGYQPNNRGEINIEGGPWYIRFFKTIKHRFWNFLNFEPLEGDLGSTYAIDNEMEAPNFTDHYEDPNLALANAVKKGQKAVAKLLIQKHGANSTRAAILAMNSGMSEIVVLMLIEEYGANKDTILMVAVKYGMLDLIRILTKKYKADPIRAVMYAIDQNEPDKVVLLFIKQCGVNPNRILAHVINKNRPDLVKILIADYKAHPTQAAIIAVAKKQPDDALALIKTLDATPINVLVAAIKFYMPEFASTLIKEYKADSTQALAGAMCANELPTAKDLIEYYKANPTQALIYLLLKKNAPPDGAVETLVELGAKLPDALLVAVHIKNQKLAETLVKEYKADPTQALIDLLGSNNSPSDGVVETLVKLGADLAIVVWGAVEQDNLKLAKVLIGKYNVDFADVLANMIDKSKASENIFNKSTGKKDGNNSKNKTRIVFVENNILYWNEMRLYGERGWYPSKNDNIDYHHFNNYILPVVEAYDDRVICKELSYGASDITDKKMIAELINLHALVNNNPSVNFVVITLWTFSTLGEAGKVIKELLMKISSLKNVIFVSSSDARAEHNPTLVFPCSLGDNENIINCESTISFNCYIDNEGNYIGIKIELPLPTCRVGQIVGRFLYETWAENPKLSKSELFELTKKKVAEHIDTIKNEFMEKLDLKKE